MYLLTLVLAVIVVSSVAYQFYLHDEIRQLKKCLDTQEKEVQRWKEAVSRLTDISVLQNERVGIIERIIPKFEDRKAWVEACSSLKTKDYLIPDPEA